MSQNGKSAKAFALSLIAGILIISNSALLGAAATWFPWIIPTLPGSSANDTTFLIRLAAVGLLFGVLVSIGAIMVRTKPVSKKAWGTMVIVFSIPSVITGGGFIIGFILGIIGGASAFSARANKQTQEGIEED
jgi:hypothetical protein